MAVDAIDPDALVLELFATDEGRSDPYSRYLSMRSLAPIHQSQSSKAWYLTRYQDCKGVLLDPRFGRGSEVGPDRFGGLAGEEVTQKRQELSRSSQQNMLFSDPPDHSRLRNMVSRAFTPKRIDALREQITKLVDPLLEDMVSLGSVDALEALAFPLPVAVIGQLVGVPPEDWASFRTLVRESTAMIEAFPTVESLERGDRAMATMEEYFRDLVKVRRQNPEDDLLSAMIAVEEGGDRLSGEELVATAILLFAAGFETTTNLIGNGLLALLQHPDQLMRLRGDPGLLPTAIEEMLRYDSPVQIDARTALEAAEVAGHPVDAGTYVITFLGAANRDPAIFDEPDSFDVGRVDNHPLSFGWGIHHCLGAHLARLEGEIVFGRLLDRCPSIELAGSDPVWRQSVTLRGLEALPIEIGA